METKGILRAEKPYLLCLFVCLRQILLCWYSALCKHTTKFSLVIMIFQSSSVYGKAKLGLYYQNKKESKEKEF